MQREMQRGGTCAALRNVVDPICRTRYSRCSSHRSIPPLARANRKARVVTTKFAQRKVILQDVSPQSRHTVSGLTATQLPQPAGEPDRVLGSGAGHGIASSVATALVSALASICLVSGFGAPAEAVSFPGFEKEFEKDPVEAFTLYGSVAKKYIIEKLDGEGHIIDRKRGVTAQSCVNAINQSLETPQFQGLPTGLKVIALGGESCGKGEDAEMAGACGAACTRACSASLARHIASEKDFTGYSLPPDDEKRMLRSCIRNCNLECSKPGKSFSFVVPYRP